MKTAVAAAVLFAGLTAGTAFARGYERVDLAPIERVAPPAAYGSGVTGPFGAADGPRYDRCIGDSAAEGNANQQNFPVKQYGQTTGGPLC